METANIYNVDEILVMKKNHPCGSNEFKVIKIGVDYKLECCKCGHQIVIPRVELKKKVLRKKEK